MFVFLYVKYLCMRFMCDLLCDVSMSVRSRLVRLCVIMFVCVVEMCVLYVSYCVMLHGLCAFSLRDCCVCLCVVYTDVCAGCCL